MNNPLFDLVVWFGLCSLFVAAALGTLLIEARRCRHLLADLLVASRDFNALLMDQTPPAAEVKDATESGTQKPVSVRGDEETW